MKNIIMETAELWQGSQVKKYTISPNVKHLAVQNKPDNQPTYPTKEIDEFIGRLSESKNNHET